MNRSITNYEELLQEKERLKELLKVHKAQIERDIVELKGELKPLVNVSHMVSKFTHREDGKDAVVTAGTNLTIDLVITKLFSKSNFVVRTLLPVLLKNFTSHYLPKAMPALKRTFAKKPGANGVSLEERTSMTERVRPNVDQSVRVSETTRTTTNPSAEAETTRVVEAHRAVNANDRTEVKRSADADLSREAELKVGKNQ